MARCRSQDSPRRAADFRISGTCSYGPWWFCDKVTNSLQPNKAECTVRAAPGRVAHSAGVEYVGVVGRQGAERGIVRTRKLRPPIFAGCHPGVNCPGHADCFAPGIFSARRIKRGMKILEIGVNPDRLGRVPTALACTGTNYCLIMICRLVCASPQPSFVARMSMT